MYDYDPQELSPNVDAEVIALDVSYLWPDYRILLRVCVVESLLWP